MVTAMTKPSDPSITLFLGGARSGKSRAAEALVTSAPPPWTYIATAQGFDAEMRERIAAHQRARAPGWRTVDAPLDLADALRLEAVRGRPVLIDCLTLWLSNHLLEGHAIAAEIDRLLTAIRSTAIPLAIVSNETGMGIVPDNALARAFRDHQGRLNQAVASLATRAVLMAAGLPLILKGPPL